MGIDDLKDQAKEQLTALWDQVQENSQFNTAKEKFVVLSSKAQRSIVIGVAAIIALFILSIPFGYLSSSGESMDGFEDNRELIRQLLNSQDTSRSGPSVKMLDIDQLRSQVTGKLGATNALPDQIEEPITLEVEDVSTIAPKQIEQQGLSVKIKKLNLRQIVDVGYRLQNISDTVKVTGLDIKASLGEDHYFDATYTLRTFIVPGAVDDEPPASSRSKNRKRKPPRNKRRGERK